MAKMQRKPGTKPSPSTWTVSSVPDEGVIFSLNSVVAINNYCYEVLSQIVISTNFTQCYAMFYSNLYV